MKTLSWRVIATTTTATIVFVMTGDFKLGLGAGAIEATVKLILYYVHERVWLRWQV